MAEGLWRALGGDVWECSSAGSNPADGVHPLAVAAMGEIGVDLRGARSKHVKEFAGQTFDLVVTVCDSARDSCPTLPGAARRLHWPFDDPAGAGGSDEEKLAVFRRVRDEIRRSIETYLKEDGARQTGPPAAPAV
jgi:arsenate reductase